MDIKEVLWEGLYWIYLTQDRDSCHAVVIGSLFYDAFQ
jgi:hypothetical protein